MDIKSFVNLFQKDEVFQKHIYLNYIEQAQEDSLKPFQVELIKLQEYLEEHDSKMIVLIEEEMLRAKEERFVVSRGI